jgi:hypothetical protein
MVVQVGNVYYWNDGAPMGNGITYNNNPYAHWSWTFLSNRFTNPSHGVYAALSGEAYDNYTGGLTYGALTTSSNYKTLTGQNKFGWTVVANTTTYQTICEVPVSAFPCPAMSPSPPPGPEGMSVCKSASMLDRSCQLPVLLMSAMLCAALLALSCYVPACSCIALAMNVTGLDSL